LRVAEGIIEFVFAPIMAFFLDSVIYGIFRGSLGKWLLGVRVVKTDGEKIGPLKYFYRNLAVMWSGCGLCIPVVSLFTALVQYNLVSNGKPTTYDMRLGLKAIKSNCTSLRTFVGITLVILIFVLKWIARVLMR
jgi:hypothetical protein